MTDMVMPMTTPALLSSPLEVVFTRKKKVACPMSMKIPKKWVYASAVAAAM